MANMKALSKSCLTNLYDSTYMKNRASVQVVTASFHAEATIRQQGLSDDHFCMKPVEITGTLALLFHCEGCALGALSTLDSYWSIFLVSDSTYIGEYLRLHTFQRRVSHKRCYQWFSCPDGRSLGCLMIVLMGMKLLVTAFPT